MLRDRAVGARHTPSTNARDAKGEDDWADSARLERLLRRLRVAVLPWLLLVIGPMFLGMKELAEVLPLAGLFANALIPAVPLHLATLLCKRQADLRAVVLLGALVFVVTLGSVGHAMDYVSSIGWRPVIWAGLLALSQLLIVLAAWRASRVAPSDGPTRHLTAFAAAAAPFVIWSALAPMHGWVGHRVSRNESAAIGDIRSIHSAQSAYQSANHGYYDIPECLVTPHRCIPAYPIDQPTFLDPQLGQTTVVTNGYRRIFHPGLPAVPTSGQKTSASSLQSYAVVAVPLAPGKTGGRGFCGDASGVICYTQDGSAPGTENGMCATPCATLQ